jgi:hypothetical protein
MPSALPEKTIEKSGADVKTLHRLSDCDKNEDHLGVVLVLNSRPQIGRYGYVSPLGLTGFEGCVFFFGESSLPSSDKRVVEGSLVHYRIEAVHGRPRVSDLHLEEFDSYDSRLDFTEHDILGLRGFPSGIQNPSCPVLRSIREKFSSGELEHLERDLGAIWWAKDTIAERLNSVIGGPLIYDKKLFAKVKLRRLTELFLKKKPENSGLRYLNRLLLEDAIASAIPDISPVPDCSPNPLQAQVFDLDENERVGKLKFRYGLAAFCYNSFPADSFIPAIGDMVDCRVGYDVLDFAFAYDIWKRSPNPAAISSVSRPKSIRHETTTEDEGFWYDLGTGRFAWPSKRNIDVPPKYKRVMDAFMGKTSTGRRSSLSYVSVAKNFAIGIMEQGMSDSAEKLRRKAISQSQHEAKCKTLRDDLKMDTDKIKADANYATEMAHSFKRAFGRWLRKNGFLEKGMVLKVQKGHYCLGSGWNTKHIAEGDSEASRVPEREQPEDS